MLKISKQSLEHAIEMASISIGKSFVDDVIDRSPSRNTIRHALSQFLGTYTCLNSEIMADSYSAFVAANEAMALLPGTENQYHFRNALDFAVSENDPRARDRLMTGEFLDIYLEGANNIKPNDLLQFTAGYFRWIAAKSRKAAESAANCSSLNEQLRKNPIEMPSGNVYSGFSTKKPIKTGAGTIKTDCIAEYMFLVNNLPDVTFSDIGGLEEHRELIYEAIRLPIEKRQEFLEKGVEAPKGMIFYGEKGCGKTYIAKAISNEMKLPFFYANGSDFRQRYLGDGPRIVRQLFDDARNIAPSLIFIDEVDACLLEVDSDDGKYSRDVVNQMLTEIDGFEVLDSVKVIVGTNHYSALDKRFIDRFPARYHLEFTLPDRDARYKALVAMTRKMKTNGINMGKLADMTEGMNFRALSFMCNCAGLYSIKDSSPEITQGHFEMSYNDCIGKVR